MCDGRRSGSQGGVRDQPTGRRRSLPAVALLLVLGLVAGGGYTVTNSRTFQVAGHLVGRVDTVERVVALTFDDGPTASDVEPILAALSARGVRATFYVTGAAARQDPEGLRRIVAAGHEVGNHTTDHHRLVGVTPDEVARQIEPTDELIRAAGWAGDITVRPPYGDKLIVAPLWLAQHGRTTVMWDVAVEDYGAGAAPQPAATIAEETLRQVQSGSIILLHPWNGRCETQAALGPLIDGLHADGYRLVTVSQLLARS